MNSVNPAKGKITIQLIHGSFLAEASGVTLGHTYQSIVSNIRNSHFGKKKVPQKHNHQNKQCYHDGRGGELH